MQKTIGYISFFLLIFLSSVNLYAQAAASPVVAGKGWEKIVLGAPQTEIEAALGKPEKYFDPGSSPDEAIASYFAKGIVVVYDRAMQRVKSLKFIGNGSLYSSSSTFKSFQGTPDKKLIWGASVAEVQRAYGEPTKREAYNLSGANSVEVVNLYYPGIHFIFKVDKLFQINIANGDTAKKN